MDKWDRKTDFNCDSCMFYVPKTEKSGRCRRNAPTMKGFPVVYGDADWCGEHKIGSNPVRDGGKAKPPTKEDIRKVLDEPLDSPAFAQPGRSESGEILLKTEEDLKKEALGEKAKIKAEIVAVLGFIIANAVEKAKSSGTYIICHANRIRKLLEKL